MTQPNAFAAAAAKASQQTQAPATYAADTNGNLTEAYTGEQTQLFGGPVLPPSLMNKTHQLNTERSGKISVAPYDVQSRDFTSKKPKFWANSPLPDGKNDLQPYFLFMTPYCALYLLPWHPPIDGFSQHANASDNHRSDRPT